MPEPDFFAGSFQCVFYDEFGRKEHIDTVRLERNGDSFSGEFAAELPGGFDAYQSHTAEISGSYNHEKDRLELEYSFDEESYNRLYFIIREGSLYGCYPDIDDSWAEWTRTG